jgi:hypothetical protein
MVLFSLFIGAQHVFQMYIDGQQETLKLKEKKKPFFFHLLGKGIDCEEGQFKCTNVNTNAILSINQWNRYIHGGRLA